MKPMTNSSSPPGHYNFLLLWILGSALWISLMLIYTASTRPAPGFALMGSLSLGVPLASLAVGLFVRVLLRRWRPDLKG